MPPRRPLPSTADMASLSGLIGEQDVNSSRALSITAGVIRTVIAILLLAAALFPAHALDRECYARIRLVQGAGFIKSYEPTADGLEVVVSEEIWNAILLPSRQGMISTLNCALRRNGQPFPRIRIRSDQTDDVIGEARGNVLTTLP